MQNRKDFKDHLVDERLAGDTAGDVVEFVAEAGIIGRTGEVMEFDSEPGATSEAVGGVGGEAD